MAWQDAAFQNMPKVNYGQPAQPQGTSIFSSQQTGPSPANYPGNPYFMGDRPGGQGTPGQYQNPYSMPALGPGQFLGRNGQIGNYGPNDQLTAMGQQRPMPFQPNWQTGGGDPGNGQRFDNLRVGPYNPSTGQYTDPAMGQSQPRPMQYNQPGQGPQQLLAMLQQIMQQRQPQQLNMQQGPNGVYEYGQKKYLGPIQQGGMNGPIFRQPGMSYAQDMGTTNRLAQGDAIMRQQAPQQPPSGMSQQMPAFIQQLLQQRMMQQQFGQMQPQQAQYGIPREMQQFGGGLTPAGITPQLQGPVGYGQGFGGGMSTGMGMQQSNPFLQMLMGLQQSRQQGLPYANNPLTNGAAIYAQNGNSFV